MAGAASAAILNVPGDYATIQAAIDAAAAGDEIVIAAGTYPTEAVIEHGDFTIRGEGLVTLVPIGSSWTTGLYMYLEDPLPPPVLVENLHFEGYTNGVNLDSGSRIEFRQCEFRQNENGVSYCGHGPVAFRDCLFEDNHGLSGGAIMTCSSALVIEDCVFSNNSAEYYGGAIFFDVGIPGTQVLSRCLFVGNQAPSGSAIQAGVDFRQTTPRSERRGGAGIPFGRDVQYVIDHCTFHANGEAGSEVVRVEGSGNALALGSSIVSGSAGRAFACGGGGALSISCTDAWDNAEGDWTDCAADQLGVNGNFSANPLFCYAAGGNFGLAAGSPCAPEGNSCGVQIGAFGVTCGATGADELPPATDISFSAIKGLY